MHPDSAPCSNPSECASMCVHTYIGGDLSIVPRCYPLGFFETGSLVGLKLTTETNLAGQ